MILTTVLIALFNAYSFHDIHIGYGTAELKEGKFSGTLSYYKDDFYKAVSTWYRRDILLMNKDQRTDAMDSYIKNYFRVWESSKQIVAKDLSIREDETTVVYTFTFAVSSKIKELKIDHRAIFETYTDHINIMNFSAFGKEYSYIFKPSAPTYILKK